jgi:TolB-like protein/Tfp pilus assembly protein PilF
MSSETVPDVKFEIGHVLFIDIVGYSKLLINQQSDQLETLKQIVRGTEQFRTAEAEGKLLRLPTGDGGALVFRNSPEAPVLCALEISRELKNHPELKVRMGIHSGPVNAITDLNEQANIAGAGINYAQRVMDCGDAGHILLSRHVAEDLEAYPRWQPHLHDLGQTSVKHGVIVSAVNLYTDDAGNPAVPERFRIVSPVSPPTPPKQSRTLGPIVIAGGAVAALAILAALVVPLMLRSRGKSAVASPNEQLLPQITPKSIAVLPFENLSSDKENAYFADGIQDEILTRLSKIAALKVISRTSTQKYKSAPDNLREVGKQLGVANLLEGSVQKIANAVHVNVQLIRAATDEHLWAESYNRKLDDVFAVEGEVATAIAEQLNANLTGAEQKAVTDKPTQNPAAYDAYLRAISVESTRTDDASLTDAASSLTRAIQLDPQFALAWARLAVVRSRFYFNGTDPATNTATAVKEAADRALALKPDLGEAHIAQGVYRYRVLRDFPGALQSYGEALKRLPNNAYVLEQMAHVERRLGDWTAAEDHYRRALELDPRNIDYLTSLAEFLSEVRHFAEAQSTWDRVLQVSPDDEVALGNKALLYQQEGRLDQSAQQLARINRNSTSVVPILAKALQLDYERRYDDAIASIQQSASTDFKNDARAITTVGWLQVWGGHDGEARSTFQRAISLIKPTPDSVVPVDSRQLRSFMAWAYAGLGEKEKALDEAKRAVADYKDDALQKPYAEVVLAWIQGYFGDSDSAIAALPHLLEVPGGVARGQLRIDPVWDPLRKDPRFQQLCQEPK